jgi:hypothetical protein
MQGGKVAEDDMDARQDLLRASEEKVRSDKPRRLFPPVKKDILIRVDIPTLNMLIKTMNEEQGPILF